MACTPNAQGVCDSGSQWAMYIGIAIVALIVLWLLFGRR